MARIKALITGGTGFIGSNMIAILSKNNFDCINLGRSFSHQCLNIRWNLKDNLNNILQGKDYDIILHSASIIGGECEKNKMECIDVNIKSTIQLLEYASKLPVKQFVYISTGGVYGCNKKMLAENNNCMPDGFYSKSKYFAEQLCQEYEKAVPITIARLFFPYGKFQQNRLLNNLKNKIQNNQLVPLNSNGTPRINPVHIKDVCNILLELIQKKVIGTFNICGEEIVSIDDIVKTMEKKLNIIAKLSYKKNNTLDLIGSNEKVKSILRYKYKIMIDQGIHDIFI